MNEPAGSGSATLSGPFLASAAALALLLHEVHELAHTMVGRALCGGWGPRDFNSWGLPESCDSWLPTLAGPLFSYAVMWIGFFLLRRPRATPLPGVALVLMANPLGRLITAVMGGGDEGVLVREWLGLERGNAARAIAFLLVAGITGPPLLAAWRALSGTGRPWKFGLLLILPMLLTGVLLFVLGNRLLAAGVLREPVLLGAPLLVWVVTVLSAVALAVWHEALPRRRRG